MAGRYRLRAYGQQNFVLPTNQHFVQKLGLYETDDFVLPTSSVSAVLTPTPKLGCSACGQSKQSRAWPPKLGRLGDDGDDSDDTSSSSYYPTAAGPPETLNTAALNADTGLAPGGIGIFGPQPTPATLQLNAAQGLAPGTSGTTTMPSAFDSLLASIAGGASNIATAAINGATARSIAQTQAQNGFNLGAAVPGLGGFTYGTLLLIGGGLLVAVVLLKKK